MFQVLILWKESLDFFFSSIILEGDGGSLKLYLPTHRNFCLRLPSPPLLWGLFWRLPLTPTPSINFLTLSLPPRFLNKLMYVLYFHIFKVSAYNELNWFSYCTLDPVEGWNMLCNCKNLTYYSYCTRDQSSCTEYYPQHEQCLQWKQLKWIAQGSIKKLPWSIAPGAAPGWCPADPGLLVRLLFRLNMSRKPRRNRFDITLYSNGFTQLLR